MANALLEGVNNFVSLDFFPGRFLPTLISQKPSIYKGLWALPTPGLWNKMEGQRHKIKNTIPFFPGEGFSFCLHRKRSRVPYSPASGINWNLYYSAYFSFI